MTNFIFISLHWFSLIVKGCAETLFHWVLLLQEEEKATLCARLRLVPFLRRPLLCFWRCLLANLRSGDRNSCLWPLLPQFEFWPDFYSSAILPSVILLFYRDLKHLDIELFRREGPRNTKIVVEKNHKRKRRVKLYFNSLFPPPLRICCVQSCAVFMKHKGSSSKNHPEWVRKPLLGAGHTCFYI